MPSRADHRIVATPLHAYMLSARTWRAIDRRLHAGAMTDVQFCRAHCAEDLMQCPNFGATSLLEFAEKLEARGLWLHGVEEFCRGRRRPESCVDLYGTSDGEMSADAIARMLALAAELERAASELRSAAQRAKVAREEMELACSSTPRPTSSPEGYDA